MTVRSSVAAASEAAWYAAVEAAWYAAFEAAAVHAGVLADVVGRGGGGAFGSMDDCCEMASN